MTESEAREEVLRMCVAAKWRVVKHGSTLEIQDLNRYDPPTIASAETCVELLEKLDAVTRPASRRKK